jgi:putative ABC transport system permease protein
LRLFGVLKVRGQEDDFNAELASHLDLHTQDGVRAGLTAEEARRQALIKLGGVEQTRQAWRERKSLPWAENFLRDLRYGIRTLARNPGFTLTAVLTLALGIGACTAIFSLVNAVLLRSLPYGDPQRLVYLYTPNAHFNLPTEVFGPSYGDLYDLKKQSHSFEAMTAFDQRTFSIASQGTAERVSAATVDGSFFQTLQSVPLLGRAIESGDDQPGHDKVAVISYPLWQQMFAGRADVLRQSLLLDGATYQIIGVMTPRFDYPSNLDLPYGNPEVKTTQIWVPLALSPQQKADHIDLSGNAIARLRPGVSTTQAQAEMRGLMTHLDPLHGPEMRGFGAAVESFTENTLGPVRPLMELLLGTVVFVLLIACGNAANLLLARTASRIRELGVRAALGAGRGRIIRQLLTESLLIGVAGGAVGIGLAFVFLHTLPGIDPGNIPRLREASLDYRVLLFTVIVSVLTSTLAGILHAMGVSRARLTDFLAAGQQRGATASHSRTQSFLIVAETALVVVLLAGAGLLIRSYINVENVQAGFSESTVSMYIRLNSHYPQPQQRRAFFSNLMEKIGALPGIPNVGAIGKLPMSNSESLSVIWVGGYPNQKNQLAERRFATPNYFSAMNIPLIAGRSFNSEDASHSAIVNESFARKYFSGRNPIGGSVGYSESMQQTVIGVVGDVHHSSLESTPEPQVYLPYANDEDWGAFIVARSTIPTSTVVSEMRSTLKSIDPNLAAGDIHTMGELVSASTARRRFQTSMLTVFAAIALLLAMVGLYGLMAYSVNLRTREVGIRMAMGAQRTDVVLLILKKAALLIGAGLVCGLGCSWLAMRALKAFLFGVGAHDPATVLLVAGLLAISGLMAALIPARRAASVDPMQALRAE